MAKPGYVYIMANVRRGTTYVGVTSDLAGRAWQHRTGALPGFSQRYGTKRLVYFEVFDEIAVAIVREKQLKKWRRTWKIELIEATNPQWNDLFLKVSL